MFAASFPLHRSSECVARRFFRHHQREAKCQRCAIVFLPPPTSRNGPPFAPHAPDRRSTTQCRSADVLSGRWPTRARETRSLRRFVAKTVVTCSTLFQRGLSVLFSMKSELANGRTWRWLRLSNVRSCVNTNNGISHVFIVCHVCCVHSSRDDDAAICTKQR